MHARRDAVECGIIALSQERLGKSEVQLVQTMIDGVGKLIDIEKALAAGKPAPSL